MSAGCPGGFLVTYFPCFAVSLAQGSMSPFLSLGVLVLPDGLLLGVSAGFTGSRHGITSFQRAALMGVLADAKPLVGHYGDCKGADYEFYLMCRALGVRTESHPGDTEGWRAFTLADVVHPGKPNLDRNRDIVDCCDYLIACPREPMMVTRSGSWATVRYARPRRTVLVIFPDGQVDISRVELLGWKSSSCPRRFSRTGPWCSASC